MIASKHCSRCRRRLVLEHFALSVDGKTRCRRCKRCALEILEIELAAALEAAAYDLQVDPAELARVAYSAGRGELAAPWLRR